jgi:hypothetical protein
MADQAVSINEGSEIQMDTRTEGTNGNHRQVVVLGDPLTNSGVASVSETAGLKVDLGTDNDVTVTNDTAANLKVDGSDVTQPVSGTVTANLGATDNAVLDQIETNQDSQTALITTIDGDTSTIAGDTTSIDTKTPALGQALKAASVPVTLASDQGDTPITLDGETVTVDLGANNDVTVTGTVDLGATDNAVLDTIATNTGASLTDTELRATPVPVSGTVTANLSATDNTVLDNIDSDTSAIKTAVETIDNAISGTEMQTDIVAPLPAGTNTIGKVAPNEYELAGNTTHVSKYYTSAGAVTDGIIWSPAAGKRWYITDLIINVSADATVTLEDDLTAGDSPVFKAELAANSGLPHSFNTPLFSGEDAADLTITTSAGNVYVTITGYEI